MVRWIFLLESILVGSIGGFAGMGSAYLIGVLQSQCGLVPMSGGESFTQAVEYFPHDMWARDFALIFLTIIGLSVLAGLYPSRKAARTGIVEAMRK